MIIPFNISSPTRSFLTVDRPVALGCGYRNLEVLEEIIHFKMHAMGYRIEGEIEGISDGNTKKEGKMVE